MIWSAYRIAARRRCILSRIGATTNQASSPHDPRCSAGTFRIGQMSTGPSFSTAGTAGTGFSTTGSATGSRPPSSAKVESDIRTSLSRPFREITTGARTASSMLTAPDRTKSLDDTRFMNYPAIRSNTPISTQATVPNHILSASGGRNQCRNIIFLFVEAVPVLRTTPDLNSFARTSGGIDRFAQVDCLCGPRGPEPLNLR
jgi:hypothetical protein